MEREITPHAGHRMRMVERFIKNPDGFHEHELLEILLYSFIPRKNTNEIAHKLLRTFGGLDKVLNASTKELMTVDGVGERTAVGISLMGKIVERVKGGLNNTLFEEYNYDSARNDLIHYFLRLKTEKCLIILLDKRQKTLAQLVFDTNKINNTFFDKKELANAIAINKPTYAIMVHNHPSGSSNPSATDDKATIAVYELCYLLGVRLTDHIVVAEYETFSYRYNERLENLIKKYNPALLK